MFGSFYDIVKYAAVREALEKKAELANIEGTEVKWGNSLLGYIEMLKPEIEQKYNVTFIPSPYGYVIKPSTNYLDEYWS